MVSEMHAWNAAHPRVINIQPCIWGSHDNGEIILQL